ncbi:MAG: hypothetical protein U0W40_13230 [Acidimicrobiia bacterium]
MVELRTEAGVVLTDPDAIDELISPCRVETVAPADWGLCADCAAAGWAAPLVQVFWPGMPDSLEQMVASFAPPHTNPADEVHQVVAGAVQFGIVRADGKQVLLTLGPGDAFRLRAGTEHWSVLSPERRLTAIVHLSLPPGFAHRYTDTEVRIT